MWDEIPIEIKNNLIDSFPDRIKACQLLAGESLNGKKSSLENFEPHTETDYKTFKKGMMKSNQSMIFFPIKLFFLAGYQELISAKNNVVKLIAKEELRFAKFSLKIYLKNSKCQKTLFTGR